MRKFRHTQLRKVWEESIVELTNEQVREWYDHRWDSYYEKFPDTRPATPQLLAADYDFDEDPDDIVEEYVNEHAANHEFVDDDYEHTEIEEITEEDDDA